MTKINTCLAFAALSGIVAIGALWVWPQAADMITNYLLLTWLGILWFLQPRYSLRLTPGELFRQMRADGYRSPASVKVFFLIVMLLFGLVVYRQFHWLHISRP